MIKRAFSLAELMVVMLILTIILAATMPILSKRSKIKAAAAMAAGDSLWETTVANANDIHNLNSRNVGIGTDTPGYLLDLVKSGGTGIDNFAYGDNKTRTEYRNDAGLQGSTTAGVGAQSGFFQASAPVNFPTGASSWWHLLDIRHSNPSNNYALQIAGSFFDQHLWFRKTNNSATTAWTQIEPTGMVVAFAGTTAPNGWLLCQGQAVSRTGVYADLFSVIGTNYGTGDGSSTFNLPDLRGMFIRGVGTSGSHKMADTTTYFTGGNTVGGYQDDAFQGHAVKTSGGNGFGSISNVMTNVSSNTAVAIVFGGAGLTLGSDGTNGSPRMTKETRPANIALNYIIKY